MDITSGKCSSVAEKQKKSTRRQAHPKSMVGLARTSSKFNTKSSSSSSSNGVMKELSELKSLIKSLADRYPPETKIILPVHTVVLLPSLDPVEAKKQTKQVKSECKKQFDATNQHCNSLANKKTSISQKLANQEGS